LTASVPTASNKPPAFLVGEHLALDFLNTAATARATRVEWLGDGKDLVDWLEQAGSIEPAAAARIRESRSDALDELARQAREFRRWLHGFVTAHRKPLRATAAAVASLNELLVRDRSFRRLEASGRDAEDGRRLLLRRARRWESPGELLQPIAEAAAGLLCNQDFRPIR
jgi:ribosomal protein L16 Arg81 hydroxylase